MHEQHVQLIIISGEIHKQGSIVVKNEKLENSGHIVLTIQWLCIIDTVALNKLLLTDLLLEISQGIDKKWNDTCIMTRPPALVFIFSAWVSNSERRYS